MNFFSERAKKKYTEATIDTLVEEQMEIVEFCEDAGKIITGHERIITDHSARIEKLENDNKLASGGGHTALWFFIVLLTIVNWVQIKLLLLSIWHCF